MEFHFRRHFRLRPKVKNAFQSASSIHHKKILVLVLNTRLGLGLGSPIGLEKGLDYITVKKVSDPKSYRPISNLSVLSKTLKRLVSKQLVAFKVTQNIGTDTDRSATYDFLLVKLG